MGRGSWKLVFLAAAVAASLSGCTNSDKADYSGPGTYQTNQAPPATPSPQVAESEAIDPLVAEEQRTPSPYKPVMKTATAPTPAKPQSMASQSGTQDVAALIQASRAAYPGSCACPYDRDRAGRKCGGRSAYSRAGGASVLCYPSDIQ